MSKKIKGKPKMTVVKKAVSKLDPAYLEDLKRSAQMLATCFHLISEAEFPGKKASFVQPAMKFLDDLYAQADNEIKAIEAAMNPPAEAPKAAPAPADPAEDEFADAAPTAEYRD